MDVNPYESPRAGEPFANESLPSSDPIRQLLVEIRDAQREALQMQREAIQRQQKSMRFAFLAPLLMLIPIGMSLYFIWSRPRFVPPAPPIRAMPRAAPATFPRPVPKPASLLQRELPGVEVAPR